MENGYDKAKATTPKRRFTFTVILAHAHTYCVGVSGNYGTGNGVEQIMVVYSVSNYPGMPDRRRYFSTVGKKFGTTYILELLYLHAQLSSLHYFNSKY